jgi:serine/threonine protein kinase
MNSDLVEELFAELLTQPHAQRLQTLSQSDYPDDVKQAAVRLCNAHESKSPFLNTDIMSDIARAAPEFFDQSGAETVEETDVRLSRGQKVGAYVVEDTIGTGGMSVVYRAIQAKPIKRRVALKFIRPSLFAPKAVKRFFREQQAVALVDHPNIATLYEVGSTSDGHPFAAMEYVNGLPITVFCQKYKLDYRQKLRVFMRACDGLFHAHRHGIVHRDIKPDNILVGVRDRRPVPKLIDFGIAKISRDDLKQNLTVTQFGQVLGSPRYMSPEQFNHSSQVDHRTDVYSAALVLFELLTTEPYRKGDTTEEIMSQVRVSQPELLSSRIKQNSRNQKELTGSNESSAELIKFAKRDLDWVMTKALAKDPDKRYSSVQAFVKDLDAAMRGKPVSVSAPRWPTRMKQFVNRNAKAFAAVAALLLVSSLVYGYFTIRSSANDLSDARQANLQSSQQTAAANDLIMRLLASDMYEMTSDQFDLNLIPAYESQYQAIHANGGPESSEDKTVYGILAVLNAMSGDFDRADVLMEEVTDDQQKDELRQVREKICSEYAATAKEKLSQLTDGQDDFERATQQMTLGRCYIVWGMLPDAEQLLNESIAFFELNRPGSYDLLVAQITLAKIYEKAGKDTERKSLLVATYEKFKNNDALLETIRGKEAFAKVVGVLAQLDPQNFGRGNESQ